jgi:hypothetical protein
VKLISLGHLLIGYNHVFLGEFALARTELEQSLLAEELLAFSGEQGFLFWTAMGAIQRGWCLSMVGRETKGIAQLTGGVATLRRIGTAEPLPYSLTLLAEAHGMAHEPAEGLKHLVEAAGLMELTEEREFEAELNRVRGELGLTPSIGFCAMPSTMTGAGMPVTSRVFSPNILALLTSRSIREVRSHSTGYADSPESSIGRAVSAAAARF